MLPTLVPIPRPVRLKRGRFTAPVFVGWLIYGLMLCALYDVLRPLWVIFVLCTKGHRLDTLPIPPWDGVLGLTPQTPISCLVQIAVAGAVMFALHGLGEVLVWRGQREKKLLVGGRAMKTYVDWIAPTFTLSLTGLPIASVPCGLDANGLPVGLQVVGPPLGEGRVLGLCRLIQEAYPIGEPDLGAL